MILSTREARRCDCAMLPMFGSCPPPNEIKRENGQRRIDVTLNVAGADLGRVSHARWNRQWFRCRSPPATARASSANISRAAGLTPTPCWSTGLLCLIGILLLVWLEFRSLRITALVAFSLPFALVGGVVGVALTGGVLSLGSLVGLRHGDRHFRAQRHHAAVALSTPPPVEEAEAFGPALILRGAEERLVPILMTALCAALALLPLVVAGQCPGHEIEHPMAIVILGGLCRRPCSTCS
jgi:Cu/Ag efflux pump CusA